MRGIGVLKNLCVVFLLVASLAFGQGVISPRQIRQAGATSGQCLKWNGSIWAPGDCVTSGGAWGGITGTLGDQTDLVTALGLRLLASNNLSDLGNAATARTNLGLGNVDNYATASQAEAEAATATDKFMTPERVSQLLDAFDVLRYAKRGNDPTAGCTDNRIYIDEDVGVPEEAFLVCRDSEWHIVGGFSVSTLLNKSGRELSLDSSVVRFTEGAGDPSGVCVQGQELYLNSSSGIYWRCKVSTGTWEALLDATSTQTVTSKTLTLPVITSYTVATLPASPTGNPIAIVTDAAEPGSCDSGSGSSLSLCRYSGAAWIPLGDGGTSGGGSGSAEVSPPYTTTVSSATTLTVTAATHGQGTDPSVLCFDGSTPRNAVSCAYSKASDGQIVFTWAPAFSGQIVISGNAVADLMTVRAVTTTTDTVLNSDCGDLVTYSNASSIAVTLPQAGASSQFAAGCRVRLLNKGAGTVTVTPTTSTIGGAASVTLETGEWVDAVSDGTNYEISATNRATAGTNVTLTKSRTGVTIAASGGSGGGGLFTFFESTGLVQNATRYASIGVTQGNATESTRQIPYGRTGTVRTLYVRLASNVGGTTDTVVATVRKNGADTALTCTISTGASTCSDTTPGHAVTVSDGADLFTVKLVASAATGTYFPYITVSFE